MNVLAIGCHPDDIEINCAGTLAKCVKRGDNVTVCHVCNGNLGHVIIQPDELAEIRKNEAIKAGSLAGIKVVTCDIGDCLVYESSKCFTKWCEPLSVINKFTKRDCKFLFFVHCHFVNTKRFKC